MENIETLKKCCEKQNVSLEILTVDEIKSNYLGGIGLETVEDFTGYDMSDDDIAYWVEGDEPYFIIEKKDKDISDRELDNALLFIGWWNNNETAS